MLCIAVNISSFQLMKKSVLTDDFEQKPNAPVEPNKYQKAKMKKVSCYIWYHFPLCSYLTCWCVIAG